MNSSPDSEEIMKRLKMNQKKNSIKAILQTETILAIDILPREIFNILNDTNSTFIPGNENNN